MNSLTLLFYGKNVKDSQSGLRAFTAHAADVINIVSRGYGVSSEFIKEISDKNLRLSEVTITTIYTPETQNKGTDAIVGLKILTKMVLDLFRIWWFKFYFGVNLLESEVYVCYYVDC